MILSAAYKKSIDISRVQIKLGVGLNTALSFIMVALTPLIFGVKNLDSVASSFVLERFTSLIGIILFTPLIYPEGDKDVQELVESKCTSPTQVYIIRIVLSLAVLVFLISVKVLFMRMNNCYFNPLAFIFGTISSALAIGALGFLAHSLSNNVVIGYMFAVFYYLINIFQGEQLKLFYLFSLSQDSITEKYWLLSLSIILLLLGVIYRNIIRKVR